jgi:hypothetical protein
MNVTLGQNTPEKNSAPGTTTGNPVVIAATVDGSGAVVISQSQLLDCLIKLIAQPSAANPTPTAGSITLQLSDADGQDLYIQPIKLCLNGVSGTMYFLCSDFVPDP